jgi:NadR type nicotinamide-nucleotide adenylyltransferase
MENKANNIIRVAFIGPESTAKSTLSEQLALHYTTVWVKEYARGFLPSLNRKYTIDDIIHIAKQQEENENTLLKKANKIIFCDTEFINLKVWCIDVFQYCPEMISQKIKARQYDLYLLTSPDIEWQSDPVRENPNRRDYFFDWYKKELNLIQATYEIIKGANEERLNNCIQAVDSLLKKQN